MKKTLSIITALIITFFIAVPSSGAERADSGAVTSEGSRTAADTAADTAAGTSAAAGSTGGKVITAAWQTADSADSTVSAANTSGGKANTTYDAGQTAEDKNWYYLADEETGIRAEILRETLDGTTFDILRGYYNDNTLSDEELFERFVVLKQSYVKALENLYNTDYLSGGGNKSETAMQLYYEGQEKLFGLNSSIYLYNIAIYKGLEQNELTHLDIIVPIKSTSSVVMIRFTIPRGQLAEQAAGKIASMLSDIGYEGLSPQEEAPALLRDSGILDVASLGIFPAASQENPVYVKFEDTSAGFSLSLPDTYIPFIQNNLGGAFTYASFKLNPHQIFSVSSEPLQDGGVQGAISRFGVTSSSSVRVLTNRTEKYGGSSFIFIRYSNLEEGSKKYFYDYYTSGDARLYKLQLQSDNAEPDSTVIKQLKNILESFTISDNFTSSATFSAGNELWLLEYRNNEEGYSFKHPDFWQVEDISRDIAHDRLKLNVPGLSGTLEVSFSESGINENTRYIDLLRNVEGNSVSNWSDLTAGYDAPFTGRTSKLLFSDYKYNDSFSTIYRLSVFKDKNGRNRLCYSADILKGKKIYSMFVTAGEYRTKGGSFDNAKINEMINLVASSFCLIDTPEAEARSISGETRNRKLIYVEDYLKQNIDSDLVVSSVEKIQSDGTMIVTVDNTGDSGFYRIRLDYAAGEVELLERVLKRDILIAEMNRLKEQYKGKAITGIFRNEANMTITIESVDNLKPGKLIHIFWVDVSKQNGKVTWKTDRVASQEDYIRECREYVSSLFASDTNVYVYGSNVFNDLEYYSGKGIKYRLLIYYKSRERSGFMALSMDPVTSAFRTESSFIPMVHAVENITNHYGIKYKGNIADSFIFDPETFILTMKVDDEAGNSRMEQFSIYFHPEEGAIKYERIIPTSPEEPSGFVDFPGFLLFGFNS